MYGDVQSPAFDGRGKVLCAIARKPASDHPMADTSPQSLMDAAKCFGCLSPSQIAAIQTQLLCELLNAGGGGGTGAACIFSGAIDPVGAPAGGCTNALYTNTATSAFFYWDNVHGAWAPLIV
jgi:hypothetical protein